MTANNTIDRYLKASVILVATVSLVLWTLFGSQIRLAAAPLSSIEDINHQCPDWGELNDTYDAAAALTIGQTQQLTLDSGGSVGTHDKDWFTFTVAGSQQVNLSVTLPATSTLLGGVEISLYTSEAGAATGVSTVTSLSGQLAWTAPATVNSQTVWVMVRNPQAASQFSFCDAAYQVILALPGNLDNSHTTKVAATGNDRTATYVITLHNTGQTLNTVTVTDQLPTGLSLTNVTIDPPAATTSLQTDQSSLTWIGQIAQQSDVVLTVTADVDQAVTTLDQNTVQINDGQSFTRSSESLQYELPLRLIFLPLLSKGM